MDLRISLRFDGDPWAPFGIGCRGVPRGVVRTWHARRSNPLVRLVVVAARHARMARSRRQSLVDGSLLLLIVIVFANNYALSRVYCFQKEKLLETSVLEGQRLLPAKTNTRGMIYNAKDMHTKSQENRDLEHLQKLEVS